MGKENFKILIRNLRTAKNAKLKIQTSADSIKFNKNSKSIRVQRNIESDNGN
mgnify:CR=1 FL=1